MDYGILLYEGAACSDFSCPLDIFHISNTLTGKGRVVTIARTLEAVRCSGGLTVTPDFTPQTAPPLDVLLVPGAEDPGQVFADNDPAFSWLQEQAGQVTFLASVCTGALILQKAGLLAGKKATTHWMLAEALSQDKEVTLLPEMRYVRDGNIVTSQGVTAGIDMALWLVGQLHTPNHARTVQRMIHYNPAPPYTAEV